MSLQQRTGLASILAHNASQPERLRIGGSGSGVENGGVQGAASATAPRHSSSSTTSIYFDRSTSFANLGLDRRIFKAVARKGYIYPSLVQSKVIPLILNGKDVLVKARTGTGKTAAYVLPMLHQILNSQGSNASGGVGGRDLNTSSQVGGLSSSSVSHNLYGVILVPTRDLCNQVYNTIVNDYTHYCQDHVRVVSLSGTASGDKTSKAGGQGKGTGSSRAGYDSSNDYTIERSLLYEDPNIIISTPSRLLQHIQDGHISLNALKMLIIDEADLVLSYGYHDDMNALAVFIMQQQGGGGSSGGVGVSNKNIKSMVSSSIPSSSPPSSTNSTTLQCIMLSATLSPELARMSGILMHSPITMDVEQQFVNKNSQGKDKNGKNVAAIQHYYSECTVYDKFLLLYVHIAFGLFKGKTIFFVNDVETAFRLKLFLSQFHIHTLVLNDDLPLNSRINMIEQFNRGGVGEDGAHCNYLIATDLSNSELDSEIEQKMDALAMQGVLSMKLDDLAASGDEGVTDDDASNELLGHKRTRSKTTKGDDDDDDEDDESEVENEEDEDEDEEGEEEDEGVESAEDEEDESENGEEDNSNNSEDDEEEDDQSVETIQSKDKNMKKQDSKGKVSSSTGVVRGIDFVDVAAVVNIDFPLTVKAYIHRAGRTARAGKAGQVFSYVSPHEMDMFQAVIDQYSLQNNDMDDKSDIIEYKTSPNLVIQRLPFDVSTANAFKYRTEECLRRITDQLVKEARIQSIQTEMLLSKRLQSHFDMNPHEAYLLRMKLSSGSSNAQRKDKKSRKNGVLSNASTSHLNYVPSYLIPEEYKRLGLVGGAVNRAADHQIRAKLGLLEGDQDEDGNGEYKGKKGGKKKSNKGGRNGGDKNKHHGGKSKSNNPLQSFQLSNRNHRTRDEIAERNTFKSLGGSARTYEESKRFRKAFDNRAGKKGGGHHKGNKRVRR